MVIVNDMDYVFLADNDLNALCSGDQPIKATGSGWALGTIQEMEQWATGAYHGVKDVSPVSLQAESLSFKLNNDTVNVGSWITLESITLYV